MTKHTVTITLDDEDYTALKELADEQDRYISGQARHMLRRSLFEAAYTKLQFDRTPAEEKIAHNLGTAHLDSEQEPPHHHNPTSATSEPLSG